MRCHYCHNLPLQSGRDIRDVQEILDMIRSSRMIISGVIFSGGEPTMQKDALIALADGCHTMGLKVGVQTNGVFPETLRALIERGLLDLVHMDIKTRWDHYPHLFRVGPEVTAHVRESLNLCMEANEDGRLKEFQVVVTLFPGREDDVYYIAKEIGDHDLVLNQGVEGSIPPLKFDEMKKIADKLRRPVKIRTREDGEVAYVDNRIIIADSIVLTDILQARRKY